VSEKGSENAKFSSKADMERAEAQTKQLESRVRELQQQVSEADKGQESASAMYKAKNKEQEEQLVRINREKEESQRKHETLAKDLKSAEKKHHENVQRLTATEGLSRNLVSSLHGLHREIGHLKESQKKVREDADTQLRYIMDRFPILKGRIEMMVSEIDHLETKHREMCEERKKLHNLVLELKGNIRVFVRIRPINTREKEQEPKEATIGFAEETKLSVWSEEQARRKWFEFDHCFQPRSTNIEVYREVEALATSVLDGYNVCIFAYGQTGSGKTYTMGGIPADPGLNNRTLSELFRLKEERKLDIETRMSIMVTEIYNEMIKDLLGGKATMQKKLDVKIDAKDGSTSVPGLTEIPVETVGEVLKCMEDAQANRTTMQTDMNDESSRSHSIVQVKTVCIHKKDKKEFIGKINLIDLAGSENTNKSGVTGQGMKEAQNINKSLSALGDVISSLVSKSSHIPYRNSKLTMMLKDSLGGDSKTLMIVQCSPAQTNVTETLSSLNFASRARNVELGKAKKNVKQGD